MPKKTKATVPAQAVQPKTDAQVLDNLPGLIGATDRYLFDATGKRIPFVLLVFMPEQAMFATNGDQANAFNMVRAFVEAKDGGANAVT